MLLNNYSVRIPEGDEENSGYVTMQHGIQYRLALRNNNLTKCNAKVEIDGKHQGTWRIDSRDSITIERPAHDDGNFTFYKVGSREGDCIGLTRNDSNTGLIKVTFTPEKLYVPDVPVMRGYVGQTKTLSSSRASGSYGTGGTGLSGTSEQHFSSAAKMQLDHSQATVIHLRLVSDDRKKPRPLTVFSNPIPPSVG